MKQVLWILQYLCTIWLNTVTIILLTSGSLWDFKRDEIVNNENLNNNNAPLFEYKANLIGNTEINGTKNGVKIGVPLKYFSNF